MGIVNIPANPSAPGHISVKLHLDITDVQSINSLLRHAKSIALQEPAAGTTSRAVEQSISDRAPADHHLPEQHVIPSQSPTIRSAPVEEDAIEGLTGGPRHAPKVVREQLPPEPVQPRHETSDPSAPQTRIEPAAPQNPWSQKVKDHGENALGSSQINFNRSSADDLAGQGPGSSGYEQYNGQRSQAIPAKISAQDWPTAQQVQTQLQRANNTTDGAGSAPYARTGGKKQMASKGFVAPIQITRMGWGDPLPNAQDIWGDEDPRPQPLASAMPAAGRPSARRPPPPSPAFPPMPEGQNPVPTRQNPGPGRPVQPQPTMHWQRMWTTDALDHVGDEVRACLHVTKMPDLVDENGGAGWLITTSAGLLNLWTCTCIGSPGEPALHLVHALETEFLTSDMQIDPSHKLLMAVGRDTKAFTECVALHHLRLQPGVFRLKGRLNLPCGVTGRLARNTGPLKALQVQSVDSYKGTMAGCCAASHDRTIVVYPATVVPGEMAKQKAFWAAHGRTITVLHANRFCPALLSGDDGGEIRIWSMIRKPAAPDAAVRHERAITGLHSLSEHSFVSCSMDGRLCVWDIKSGKRPISILHSPDNRPILKMAVHHDGLVAFCTHTGLYVADVFHDSPIYTLAVTQEHEDPVGCLTWNAGSTGQTYLYASNSATISAYRASQY
ncbi:hypothetical protein ABBQ32_013819 [Trebouxia sp. C0010 RCD-2024]